MDLLFRWCPQTVSTTNGHQISLTSGSAFDTPEPIQRISITKGQRTLGVRLAPDGNDNDEYNYRIQQANTMSQRIKEAPLGREHIGVGFWAIWRMMIQYPLGATCFSAKQCTKLEARYLPTFLSKMGINRSTATAVRHGPSFYGGMDTFQLDTEQGVQHTALTVAHLRKDNEVGRMFTISIDHLQLQAGVSWPVLSQPGHKQRLYVDPCRHQYLGIPRLRRQSHPTRTKPMDPTPTDGRHLYHGSPIEPPQHPTHQTGTCTTVPIILGRNNTGGHQYQ
jgi:hypothetical protein